ncbi:hypothetical protein [Streptacidiphilus rugosus]|uniref:hypothetical protein n=1 Tax=Streptacidiphilus rugosus TaxID=405783 RepID=UPI00055E6617|nr:hypothetical protein [Streptacidiphilus rugosus]
MQHAYIVGHRARRAQTTTFVPGGLQVLLYAQPGADLSLSVARSLLAASSSPQRVVAVKRAGDVLCNAPLTGVNGTELAQVRAVMACEDSLWTVGDRLPSPSRPCTADDPHACGRGGGMFHTCDGFLARLPRENVRTLHLLTCVIDPGSVHPARSDVVLDESLT